MAARLSDDEFPTLVESAPGGKRQLYVRGTRIAAARVWEDMIVNGQKAADAAVEWHLPLDAIEEIVRYCEGARALIAMEARQERRQARAAGVRLKRPG